MKLNGSTLYFVTTPTLTLSFICSSEVGSRGKYKNSISKLFLVSLRLVLFLRSAFFGLLVVPKLIFFFLKNEVAKTSDESHEKFFIAVLTDDPNQNGFYELAML